MVELARESDGRFGLRYGGDTFNTAVYASRCGLRTAYATALGDDPYSDGIVTLAASEGIETGCMRRLAGRMPGLYIIETDGRGERSFWYWRSAAAARQLFDAPDPNLVEAICSARNVYVSGITLSLYSEAGLDRFSQLLAEARKRGATVSFDSNYRPRGWRDAAHAREVFARFISLSDLLLPSLDDEKALWGDAGVRDTIARYATTPELVLKDGEGGVLLVQRGKNPVAVAVPERITPVDTTAAGDSFNAAYLAARHRGESPEAAALLGHRLAGIVIQHRGAIVPREATGRVTGQHAVEG